MAQAKYLSIPVTGRGNMLLGASNVALVEQKSTTKVRISYVDGTQADITHAASAAGSEEVRTYIQDSIQAINRLGWQNTTKQLDALPKAVTDVAISLIT